jgi:hypothetical protein
MAGKEAIEALLQGKPIFGYTEVLAQAIEYQELGRQRHIDELLRGLVGYQELQGFLKKVDRELILIPSSTQNPRTRVTLTAEGSIRIHEGAELSDYRLVPAPPDVYPGFVDESGKMFLCVSISSKHSDSFLPVVYAKRPFIGQTKDTILLTALSYLSEMVDSARGRGQL